MNKEGEFTLKKMKENEELDNINEMMAEEEQMATCRREERLVREEQCREGDEGMGEEVLVLDVLLQEPSIKSFKSLKLDLIKTLAGCTESGGSAE